MKQSIVAYSTPHNAGKPAWKAWWILWLSMIFILSSLLFFNARLDTYIWCATRWAVGDGQYYSWKSFHAEHLKDVNPPFYMIWEPPMGSQFYARSEWLWFAFKAGGEAWMSAAVLGGVALFHRRRIMAAAGLASVAIPGIAGELMRIVDGRFRPTHHDGANTWVWFRGFYNGTDLSFPSGHATAAFALAAVLGYLFPRGRPLFLLLATLTAISRVVQEAHFWSDVLCGATLGWSGAWLTMQAVDRFLSRRAVIGGTSLSK
jgi:membrane-associated phospholipid phosphatase